MAALTPREQAIRDRIEALIRVMQPGLDLLLALGDLVSRRLEPKDDWEPPRPASSAIAGVTPRRPGTRS